MTAGEYRKMKLDGLQYPDDFYPLIQFTIDGVLVITPCDDPRAAEYLKTIGASKERGQ